MIKGLIFSLILAAGSLMVCFGLYGEDLLYADKGQEKPAQTGNG